MTKQPSLFGAEVHHGDFGQYRVDQADCVEWLRRMPPESLDLWITDPAYESLEKHRAHGTTTRLQTWFEIFRNERFPELFAAAYRALRPNTHGYMFCDEATADIAKPLIRAAGFTFWKSIIWDKKHIGMGYHFRCRYEFILFFEKGARRLNDLGMADVFDVPVAPITDDIVEAARIVGEYPTQKPIEAITPLVLQSSRPGDIVADCFAGSGSTGEAALRCGRRFLGCDVSEAAVRGIDARLAAVGAQRC